MYKAKHWWYGYLKKIERKMMQEAASLNKTESNTDLLMRLTIFFSPLVVFSLLA